MTADILANQNSAVISNGDLNKKNSNPNLPSAASKKSRESERRRRRRKQKKNKNKKTSQQDNDAADGIVSEAGDSDAGEDEMKENSDHQQVMEQVLVEYVPEKADLDDGIDEEFRKVFEKFSFWEAAGSEEMDKKDESAQDAEAKKKADSDSEEEEQDNQQKEKGGLSNKKKKLQRRMKIAELKQICSRPDVVEVWDATAADPKLLVFLKAYRNTVPVPRHWCQKRKYLQGNSCDSLGARTYRCFAKRTID